MLAIASHSDYKRRMLQALQEEVTYFITRIDVKWLDEIKPKAIALYILDSS